MEDQRDPDPIDIYAGVARIPAAYKQPTGVQRRAHCARQVGDRPQRIAHRPRGGADISGGQRAADHLSPELVVGGGQAPTRSNSNGLRNRRGSSADERRAGARGRAERRAERWAERWAEVYCQRNFNRHRSVAFPRRNKPKLPGQRGHVPGPEHEPRVVGVQPHGQRPFPDLKHVEHRDILDRSAHSDLKPNVHGKRISSGIGLDGPREQQRSQRHWRDEGHRWDEGRRRCSIIGPKRHGRIRRPSRHRHPRKEHQAGSQPERESNEHFLR